MTLEAKVRMNGLVRLQCAEVLFDFSGERAATFVA